MILQKGGDLMEQAYLEQMEKVISSTCYKTKDRIGVLITEVFELENGIYNAYSSYKKDDEIIGYAESNDQNIAVRLSRKQLRKIWNDAYQIK
jgi:hypothetical protein